MKVRFDKDADALYLELSEGLVKNSDMVSPHIVLDSDPDGEVIGIEILNVSKRSQKIDLKNILLQTA
jgi:uncharacterized protein YuzE